MGEFRCSEVVRWCSNPHVIFVSLLLAAMLCVSLAPSVQGMRGEIDSTLGLGKPSYIHAFYRFGFETDGEVFASVASQHSPVSHARNSESLRFDEGTSVDCTEQRVVSSSTSPTRMTTSSAQQHCSPPIAAHQGQPPSIHHHAVGHAAQAVMSPARTLPTRNAPRPNAHDGVASLASSYDHMGHVYGVYLMSCPKKALPSLHAAAGSGRACVDAVLTSTCQYTKINDNGITQVRTKQAKGMRYIVVVACESDGNYTMKTKFSLTNPTERHLGTEWTPLPTALFIVSVAWLALVLYVVFNITLHKMFCTPLHVNLCMVMGIKAMATGISALSWSELDSSGSVSGESRLQATVTFAMLFEALWQASFLCIVMYMAKGWMITRISVIRNDKTSTFVIVSACLMLFVCYCFSTSAFGSQVDDSNINSGDQDTTSSTSPLFIWVYLLYCVIVVIILTSAYISMQDLTALMYPLFGHPAVNVSKTPAAAKLLMFRYLQALTVSYGATSLLIKEMDTIMIVRPDYMERNLWLKVMLKELNTFVHSIVFIALFRLRKVNSFNVILLLSMRDAEADARRAAETARHESSTGDSERDDRARSASGDVSINIGPRHLISGILNHSIGMEALGIVPGDTYDTSSRWAGSVAARNYMMHWSPPLPPPLLDLPRLRTGFAGENDIGDPSRGHVAAVREVEDSQTSTPRSASETPLHTLRQSQSQRSFVSASMTVSAAIHHHHGRSHSIDASSLDALTRQLRSLPSPPRPLVPPPPPPPPPPEEPASPPPSSSSSSLEPPPIGLRARNRSRRRDNTGAERASFDDRVVVEVSRRIDRPAGIFGLLPLNVLRRSDTQRQLVVIANPPSKNRGLSLLTKDSSEHRDASTRGKHFRRVCDFAVGEHLRPSFLPLRLKPKTYVMRVLGAEHLATAYREQRAKIKRTKLAELPFLNAIEDPHSSGAGRWAESVAGSTSGNHVTTGDDVLLPPLPRTSAIPPQSQSSRSPRAQQRHTVGSGRRPHQPSRFFRANNKIAAAPPPTDPPPPPPQS